MEKKLKQFIYVDVVKIRSFKPDKENIIALLKSHKSMTNKQIALELNLPQTLVEHWFRTDSSFCLPDPDSWFRLKALLKIESNEFDYQVASFDEKQSVFEKAGRVYGEKGVSPTLLTNSETKVIKRWKRKKN